MPAEITLDELLSEYARLGITATAADGGLTTAEWADRWGISAERARTLIGKAVRAKLVTCGKKTVQRMDGAPTQSPCYTFTLPKKAGKKGKK